MLRWFRSLFAWEVALDNGVHRYEQNRITGERRLIGLTRFGRSGYVPIDRQWLAGGEWARPPVKPIPMGWF